jgi:hypothetical protein
LEKHLNGKHGYPNPSLKKKLISKDRFNEELETWLSENDLGIERNPSPSPEAEKPRIRKRKIMSSHREKEPYTPGNSSTTFTADLE